MISPLGLYRERLAAGALSPDPGQERAIERLEALSQALAAWRPGGLFRLGRGRKPRGLYLYGAVGRGKSMLMDLFFEVAPVARKTRVHFHEFMQAQHAFMREARSNGEGQDQLIARAAKAVAEEARLVCFDELQVTDIADAMILGRLFEHLFALDVVMVATSNRPPTDLYKNGLNRQLFLPFIALLEAEMETVEIEAARDYRLDRLMEAPVYHTPLGPLAEQAMDRAWARLTEGAKGRPVQFMVQGRTLRVPCAAAGCARFSFEALCAQPLGPADYLELAEQFHTVLLDGVPKLTPDRREEAARFRTLIDALYERRTKLVCSAAAEPAALYPEGEQSFEFERTASRLMEMRSKDYLGAPRRDREWMRGVVDG